MNLKQSFVRKPGHVRALAVHLQRADQNESVRVLDYRGVTQRRELADTLQAMFRTKHTTQGENGLYQVSINPEAHHAETMNSADWGRCLDAVEKEFNLAGQPRVLVEHVKDGRRHVHAVYQTADVERSRQVDDFGHNYRRGAKVARQLERELGHTIQPERSQRGGNYTQGDNERAKREGRSAEEWRQDVREAWKATRTAEAFRERLQAKGYDVAEGKGGRVCVVSPDGQPAALGAMLKGIATAQQAKARFDGHQLESVEQMAERHRDRPGHGHGDQDDRDGRDLDAAQERAAQQIDAFRERDGQQPRDPKPHDLDAAQDKAAQLLETFRQHEANRTAGREAHDLEAAQDHAAELLDTFRQREADRTTEREAEKPPPAPEPTTQEQEQLDRMNALSSLFAATSDEIAAEEERRRQQRERDREQGLDYG